MIGIIRDAIAYPFYLLALTFIFLDTLIAVGLQPAVDMVWEITHYEEE